MLNASHVTPPNVIDALSRIRAEWQNAVQDHNLLATEGNVGLILADVVNGLGLCPDEKALVLGQSLFEEMREFLNNVVAH